MSKFKVGDEVIRIEQSGLLTVGEKYTIHWVSTCGTLIKVGVLNNLFEVADFAPSKWHKHHDVIVAWAKGAKIQFRLRDAKKWLDENGTPLWEKTTEYRVKPEQSEAQFELEKLQEKIAELQEQAKKIEEKL